MDSITKQWDFGVTAVASVDKLYGMIRAVSEDNVQGQAILAIMALGAGLTVDDKLIGTGVDALGGQKNVKLQNLKVAIGLFSGGTTSVLRTSTPGVKAFLLLVGLKMWQNDVDVGDILYNMAISTGVMKSYPASAYQFAQAVSALSGYASSIIPSQHLHDVGECVMSFCNSGHGLRIRPRLFGLVYAKSIAEILTKVFTALQDKEISRITLQGDVSGIWIVALLTWLLPDETCVHLQNQLIMGNGTKLLIQLRKSENADCSWDFIEWKEERSLKSLIECSTFANCPPGSTVGGYRALDRMGNSGAWVPWTICKCYIQSAMDISSGVAALIGQLAGVLLQFVVEEGKIHSHAESDEDDAPSVPFSTVSLLDISGGFFTNNYGSFMLNFGWGDEDLDYGAGKVATEFKRILATGVRFPPFPAIKNAMTEAINSVHKSSRQFAHVFLEDAVAMAIYVASEALSALTYQPAPGEVGRSHAPIMNFTTYNQREKMLHQLVSLGGIDVHDFRQNLLKIVTSRDLDLAGDELILESNGMVIVPAMLLEPSTKQSRTLGLHLIPGTIKQNRHRYTIIRENAFGLVTKGRGAPLQLFHQGKYCGVPPHTMDEKCHPELDIFTTIKGEVIYIRPVLAFHTDPSGSQPERDLRWLKAIENLATAKHLGRMDQLSPRAEEHLARRLFENGALGDAFWIKSFSGESRDYIHSNTRLVARTAGDELLRVYQASISRDCVLVIQHEASLIKAIAVAGEASNNWIIIT